MRKTMKSDPARKSTGRAKTKKTLYDEGRKKAIAAGKAKRQHLQKRGMWPD